MVNNTLRSPGANAKKISKKKRTNRERGGESRVERNVWALESINLTGIEFIGNYFSRAYGSFASIDDEDEGETVARGRVCNGGCE